MTQPRCPVIGECIRFDTHVRVLYYCPPKVLIPKDWPWEGVPPLPASKHQTQKKTSSQATTKKIYFRGGWGRITVGSIANNISIYVYIQ